MPDSRKHRGPAPKDSTLFGSAYHYALRAAVADLSWLLTRHYSEKAALKLVGDRYNLRERQRLAVQRSDQALCYRQKQELAINQIHGQALVIDTYNLLILIESVLAGAYIFKGRDGWYRDLAGIHGNYRKVAETVPAIETIGSFLQNCHCRPITWLIDQPVSNYGLLTQGQWYWPQFSAC
ncbi:MAG: DUF434 domain-containing protein [Bacteroidetes bacterium SW_11_45_7]|nr:MAG: DUF434 domain-containing protein [Bacteroidetes bacterium SW_11_45_7]